jgi:CDP-6-deoxy-D-xylo-4-hexulose-3-dehydrase
MNHPLMNNNFTKEDREALIQFLQTDARVTQGPKVLEFEQEWSRWLGVKYSVLVNSGSSANFLTMALLREMKGQGEVLVPTLTWSSDIVSVIRNDFTPVFVDINPYTLAMDEEEILKKITKNTKAVFLTHILGLNGLSERLLTELKQREIPLIEDVCESHGATFQGKKLGSFGLASNFSFYFAHHLTTIEGGMVCTNDEEVYEMARLFRSHGLVREARSESFKKRYAKEHPDLNPEFTFAVPGFNFRGHELSAVIGLSQLPRLDEGVKKRKENLELFLSHLDESKFETQFQLAGQSSYALLVVLKEKNEKLLQSVMSYMDKKGFEYRRGLSGGGNQLRQPFVQKHLGPQDVEAYPHTEHVHFYGFYLGNYPDLESQKIVELAKGLNSL